MPSYVLGMTCLVSFVAAFGIYTSHEKGNMAKNIGLVLSLVVLTVSISLFAGFDILAERVYVSSDILSTETSNLVVIERPDYYLTWDGKGYEFRYIGETGNEIASFVDAEYSSSDVEYDANEVPQVIEEKVAKKYYKKWLFLKSGVQSEKCIEYKFIIPGEENILHK